jgi:putative hemolysin
MSTFAVTLLFTLAVAAMTAAATAVRSVSRIWLRHWAERQLAGGTGAAQAAPTLGRPHDLLLAAGTGIAATVFALGAFIGLREDRSALLRHLGVAVFLLLAMGQLAPRAVARRWATAIVPMLTPVLRALHALFGPILGFAARMARPWVSAAPGEAPPEPTDPLEDLLRDAEMEGIGEPTESEIITGLVEFGEKRVGDVMTPRARVLSVAETLPPRDVAETIARSGYTRVPVFGPDGRDVRGLVHAFDVLDHPDTPLATLRPTAEARFDEPCSAVMRRMLRDRRHLSIVRDAGGAVAGIVTLEDLVEELVGDIRDEHDEPAGPP